MKEAEPKKNSVISTADIEFHEDNLVQHLERHFNGSPGSQFLRSQFEYPSDVIGYVRHLFKLKKEMTLRPIGKNQYRGMHVFKHDTKIGYQGLFELGEFTRRYPEKN